MSITFDAQGVEQAKVILASCPDRIRVAAANAVNRTITKLRTAISKNVRSEYVIPAKKVKETLSISRASRSRISGYIKSTGRPVPLQVFRVSNNKSGPLKARVRKNAAPVPVQGMFRGVSRKGYAGLMQRKHKRQAYPLRIPYGPSVPQMLGAEQVTKKIERDAEQFLRERFLHEVEQQFRMHGGK